MGSTLNELFHAMEVPMLFLSFDGTIVECNAAARRMVDGEGLLRTERGALAYCDGREWRSVAKAWERFAAGSMSVIELIAQDRAGLSTATVTLRPMHSAFTDKLLQHERAVVCTVTTQKGGKPHAGVRAFGLTNAEHQVAQGLVNGVSVSNIARQRGVAVSTVRTHLAALFGKTGTRQQVELVATLHAAGMAPSLNLPQSWRSAAAP